MIARLDAALTIASRAGSVINGCTDDELNEIPLPDTRTKSVGRMQICVATSCAEIPRTPLVEQPLERATALTVCADAAGVAHTIAANRTRALITDEQSRLRSAIQRTARGRAVAFTRARHRLGAPTMNLRTLIARIGLGKLNSLTKYPSILTYHALGERGRLQPERNRLFLEGQRVVVTEKIDGTNTRIVLLPHTGEFLIGSREEWLHARGDLVCNPALGIVEAVRAIAEQCASVLADERAAPSILAIYGEVYGGKVSAASKEYTAGDATRFGFRVFDAWREDIDALATRSETLSPEQLAAWREDGAQRWLDDAALEALATTIGVARTPRIDALAPPEGIDETFAWLKATLPRSLAPLSDAANGHPEGLVVRTHDRGVIAKIRYEDYERASRSR